MRNEESLNKARCNNSQKIINSKQQELKNSHSINVNNKIWENVPLLANYVLLSPQT
jgi:hypothetical protein